MSNPTILLVDDDAAVIRALESVGEWMKLPVRAFSSAESFLASDYLIAEGCLIIDIRLPGLSGLDLQNELRDRSCALPVIIISGHADVPLAVEAMTRGALTVLEKPFSLDQLMKHIRQAIELDRTRRESSLSRKLAADRLARLTDREREVVDLIAQGLTNKEIAAELKITVRAIEDRRSRLMRRLEVGSVAELIQTIERAAAQ